MGANIIVLIFCHSKNTKFDVIRCSGARSALEYVFDRASAPDPAGGAQSAPPDLAALREPTCMGRKHRGQKKTEIREKGTEGENRKRGSVQRGKRKKKGPWMIFLQGAQNLKN